MIRSLAAVALSFAACSGGGDSAPDAASDAAIDAGFGDCWPIGDVRHGGSIELGTGQNAFVPMPDELEVVESPSSSLYLPVHSRMTGLQPGDPAFILDPNNPHTRFRAFFVDTDLKVSSNRCGFRYGYTRSVGPAFDLANGGFVSYESDIFDRQVRVVVEIIDSAGSYATAEKIVVARKPANWP